MRIAIVVCFVASGTAFGNIVQWEGNDHHYQLFSPEGGITWTDARDVAQLLSYQGHEGHLVTITSEAEFEFVITTFPKSFTWIGFTDSAVEGTFEWITGEPVTFDGWFNHEPNNAASGVGEDWAYYAARGDVWGWNDYRDVVEVDPGAVQFPTSYLVEFDTIPEPASVSIICLLGAFSLRRRG